MESIGSNIKKVIKEKGFTLEQVASQMKAGVRNEDAIRRLKQKGEEASRSFSITQSALSQMLKGNPSISRVKEIAEIVGVSVSELIGDAPVTRGAIVGATITCPHCKKDIYLHVEDEDYKDYESDPHSIALNKSVNENID